jgi:hypothetical protein
MRQDSTWGGYPEMAALSQMREVNVHIYQKTKKGFQRILAIDCKDSPQDKRVVKVLYVGNSHYDAIR